MTTFRSAQVHSPGGEFARVDRELADPGPGAVRVVVEACGICHPDSVFVDDLWPALQFPVTPGHEIAGHKRLEGGSRASGLALPSAPAQLSWLSLGLSGGSSWCADIC